MYYFNARWYDKNLGRFISEDPLWGNIRDPQSLNRYRYARNNPFRYSDPTGMYDDQDNNGDSETFGGADDGQDDEGYGSLGAGEACTVGDNLFNPISTDSQYPYGYIDKSGKLQIQNFPKPGSLQIKFYNNNGGLVVVTISGSLGFMGLDYNPITDEVTIVPGMIAGAGLHIEFDRDPFREFPLGLDFGLSKYGGISTSMDFSTTTVNIGVGVGSPVTPYLGTGYGVGSDPYNFYEMYP